MFAIDFTNDSLDFVMWVRKRFYDQPHIFPALKFLAKSPDQNVGRLARKAGRDVQKVKCISTSPADRLRRLGKDMIGPIADNFDGDRYPVPRQNIADISGRHRHQVQAAVEVLYKFRWE